MRKKKKPKPEKKGRKKGGKREKSLFLLISGAVLVGFLLGAGTLFLLRNEQPEKPVEEAPEWKNGCTAFSDRFRADLGPCLKALGVWKELIRERSPRGGEAFHRIRVRVPRDLSLMECNLEITRLAHRIEGRVISAVETPKQGAVVMTLGVKGVPTDVVTLVRDAEIVRRAGRIGIILDDFGPQTTKRIEPFCRISQRLTLSVFPNGKRSGEVAETIHGSGHQVMIHLPMEPHHYPKEDPGEDAIYVWQSVEEIRKRTRTAIGTVPHAVGLNNHMGSRATEDEQVMRAVLGEVKRKKLFFVDSYTSSRSVAFEVAKAMKVRCARRAVFLDHVDDPQAIRMALAKLANLAAQNGSALGIGHPRLNTLDVLKDVLPKLQKQGFQFVWASELVE
ncbi:MAG: divergent polysaccharide deacetylase family protein [Candidatus Latescibacteria bacterium]|nr:divergent polysaccharide deacetylase family protein [Candidatus Latescibacterota bacterium]